jgi:AcrR family transcriptional regulator
VNKPLAHRPSRREEVVDAAISVFAQRGFVDASITEVADKAGVAVTAVYYHFAGKDELYEAAITRVLGTVDDIVDSVRRDDEAASPGDLHRVIDAVWIWVDEFPDSAALMHLHTPVATRRSAELRHEFDELHIRRAFAYVNGEATALGTSRQAKATIALRTLVDMLIAIHPMRLPGGPLSTLPPNQLRKAVKQVSDRLLAAV